MSFRDNLFSLSAVASFSVYVRGDTAERVRHHSERRSGSGQSAPLRRNYADARGYDDLRDDLFQAIDEIGVEPERLIVTHADPDHVEAFDATVERYDLETWVPEEADLDAEHDPDHRYGDREQIGRFETVSVPGHTPGSSALADEDANILVAGDTLVGADWRGLPEGYLVPPPEGFTEDPVAAERNLDRLLRYEFDTALVYHGSSVFENASEKLDAFLNYQGRPD